MSDDLVKRLRGRSAFCRDRSEVKSPELMDEAADHIQKLEAKLAKLVKAVEALKSIAYESVDEEGIYIAIYALFEIEGEKE